MTHQETTPYEQAPNHEVAIGGTYQHTHGTTYRVDALITRATGYERSGDLGRDVLYTQLTDGQVNPAGTQYTRSEEEFLHGSEEIDGKQVPLFTLVASEVVVDARPKARKVSLDETQRFDRAGFSGNVYVASEEKEGFNALLVDVHGRHPKKRILDGNTRSYFVAKGNGTFIVDGESHEVKEGDLFVIPADGEYEYEGAMSLFEFNVSPDNSFSDEKLE